MTAIEIKKELIKKVVNPFFKTTGFTKRGVNFYQDLSYFQIEADIQNQRYYKEQGIENFRINYRISCSHFTSQYGYKECFGGGDIAGETSWVRIDSETQLATLSDWIQKELNKITELVDIYSDISNIEKIIDLIRNVQDIRYAFLLREFNKEKELAEWKALRKEEKTKYLLQVKEVEENKRNLENRPDSLDKTVRLEGVAMQLGSLSDKIKAIDKELQMIEQKNCT
jgi:glutamate synthase domain-containing protein 2